jgi:uncharacterized protein (TIGR01777 family)
VRLLLAGASGLIGRALADSSRAAGDEVHRLVRRPAAAADEIEWHPDAGQFDPERLDGIDAVVCLSGVGVGDHRWTPAYKREILASRIGPVGTLAGAIAARADAGAPVPTLVTASAVGYYGETGDREVDESAPNGDGFLAEVCRMWESATRPAAAAGARVVQLRSGIVLARRGPVLARMLPLFRLGVGGPLGNGRQYWSWITLTDEIAAIRFILASDELTGPVNLSAPTPVTNAEFTRTLARLVHRPAIVPAPAAALRAVLGGFSTEILSSQRVLPAKLLAAGFEFTQPDLETGLRAELR